MSVKQCYDAIRQDNEQIRHDIYKFIVSSGIDADIKEILEDADTLEIYRTNNKGEHLEKVWSKSREQHKQGKHISEPGGSGQRQQNYLI